MNEFDIWYSMVKLSPKIKLDLLKKFKNTEQIWYYCKSSNYDTEYLNSKVVDFILNSWDENKIEKAKNKLLQDNIKIVNYFHEDYPKRLKYFDNSPSILFYKGNINFLNNNLAVAIVGSRKCTYYGENVTQLIVRELCKYKVDIISGMARGIDSVAHKTTLENEGYTCAVLGCGIDKIYPPENKNLYKKIMEKGCILSEFPLGTPPYAQNFPIRNRIISGLSDVVVVAEADIKSGSLITASEALNQGKDVMAVPGSIFFTRSMGTNKLIKDGAFPFTSMQDLLDLLDLKCINKKKRIKDICNDKKYATINNVLSDRPIHIDEIIRLTNIDIKCLYELLFEMQMKKEVKCLAGNYYVKIKKEFL